MIIYKVNGKQFSSMWEAAQHAIAISEGKTKAVFVTNQSGDTIRIYFQGRRVLNAPFADKAQD